jgi:hypothetical protein
MSLLCEVIGRRRATRHALVLNRNDSSSPMSKSNPLFGLDSIDIPSLKHSQKPAISARRMRIIILPNFAENDEACIRVFK